MFCAHKNSYLQLEVAVNARAINRSVQAAQMALRGDCGCVEPPPSRRQRLSSAHPSLYAPCVDITRARLGFARIGLRKLIRDLHSPDALIQLQSLHTLLDQVQLPESAFYLISRNVVHRLVDLMLNPDAVIREKVCLILTFLSKLHQGRKSILTRKLILQNLMHMIVKDEKKEIRYAAAFTLMTLARDRCVAETLTMVENIVPELLDMVRQDFIGIVLLHLKTLESLLEWEQTEGLRCGAFHIMMALFAHRDPRVAVGGLDCARQLLKHPQGRNLADQHDLVFVLHGLLRHEYVEVIMSAAALLQYATLTTQSKWRARERCAAITRTLVHLCYSFNKPQLQMSCLKVLINLCDAPDIRAYVKGNFEQKIEDLKIRTHEQWDGTSETTSYDLETGHNYRTLCIENVETIRNDNEGEEAVNVHSYLASLHKVKKQLIKAINWTPYN